MKPSESREDRVALVASLCIPVEAEAPARYVEEGGPLSGAGLAALVDDEVVRRTWLRWSATYAGRIEEGPFRSTLRRILAAGVGMGYALDRFRATCQELSETDPDGERWEEAFESAVVATNTVDLRVSVNPTVHDVFAATNSAPQNGQERWGSLVATMSDGLFYELGIVLPRVELFADSALATTEIRIRINDAQLPRQALLEPGRALVNDTVDRLSLLNITGQLARNPANDRECATIDAGDARTCEQAGLTTWTPMGHAILTTSAVARRMAGAFVNSQLVDFYLNELARGFPTVVAEARKAISREALSQLLRALVDEEISLRNLIRILEVVTLLDAVVPIDVARYIPFSPAVLERAQWYRHEPPLEARLHRVRASMRRYISHKYTRGGNTLVVYLVAPALEERLETPVPLSSAEQALLLRAIREEVVTVPAPAQDIVILTTGSVRLRLRQEIAATMPRTAVLCYQELSPDMNIRPLARIEAPELERPADHGIYRHPANASFESILRLSDDPLVKTLYPARTSVLSKAIPKAGLGARAERFMPECLDAILGELIDAGTAVRLAGTLRIRPNLPGAWDRILEMILGLGAAAEATCHLPVEDLTAPRSRYFGDRARIRAATHKVAREVVAAGLRTVADERR